MAAIRVLYVNGGQLDYGGITSFMINYCKLFDPHKIKVDIIAHGLDKGPREEELINIGCKVYHVPYKSKDYFGNIRALRRIFRTGKYQIVHSHMDAMNGFVLKQARICKVPIRISHSHNSQFITKNKFKLLANRHSRKLIPKYATHLFACSELAGRWLYGDRLFNSGQVYLIKNAVDVKKYMYNSNNREKKRRELKLNNDQYVIGHVGRFNLQKNQQFLLDVFSDLLKIKPNAILILIGEGPLKINIKQRISEMGLEKEIVLMKDRKDIPQLLDAFDSFILPSIFEGLPLVLIEAQIAGLPCFVSNNVSKESQINRNCYFISLNKSAEFWANKIKQESINQISRELNEKNVISKGYDIKYEALKLQKLYMNIVSKNK